MRQPDPRIQRIVLSVVIVAMGALSALPAAAGIHYKAVTKTEDPQTKGGSIEVEGWVSGDKARVEFKESANPMAPTGTWILTRDGGKTMYMVDPKEKTYAEWNLQAMLGAAGAVMNGMGPLLKIEFTTPKVETLLDEAGPALVGLPTRHYRHRTTYVTKVRVLGMANESSVVSEQEIWTTDKLTDVGLGVWLRNDPPPTGNEQFDKLLAAEMGKTEGFPLKSVTVTTTTQKKGNKQSVSRTTMEVTQLDINANVPGSSFEIPAGYKETEMTPVAEGDGGEDGGLGALLRGRNKKPNDGN